MEKTKFNKIHKYTITLKGDKYRIIHTKDENPCKHCDCYITRNCLDSYNLTHYCLLTIGRDAYLKRIKHRNHA